MIFIRNRGPGLMATRSLKRFKGLQKSRSTFSLETKADSEIKELRIFFLDIEMVLNYRYLTSTLKGIRRLDRVIVISISPKLAPARANSRLLSAIGRRDAFSG